MEEEKEYYGYTQSPSEETRVLLEQHDVSGSDDFNEKIGAILDELEKYLTEYDRSEVKDDASMRARIDRIKHRLIYDETFDEFKQSVCGEFSDSAIQDGIFSITKAAFEPGV